MSATSLFVQISDPHVRTFRHRLIILYNSLDLPEAILQQTERLMDRLNIPAGDRRVTIKELQLSLKGQLTSNPFPALIYAACCEAKERLKTGELTEQEFLKYQWLSWSVLHVSLQLKAEELEGEGDYNAAISTACHAVRLLLDRGMDVLRRFPAFSDRIYDNYKAMTVFFEAEGADEAHEYVRKIHNLLNRYFSETGPINRERQRLNSVGLQEYGIGSDEDDDMCLMRDRFSLPGGRIDNSEFTADFPTKEQDVDCGALDHADPIAQVSDLQESDNRFYSYARTKQHAMISTSLSRLKSHQARAIYEACEKLWDETHQFEFMFFALSIILGRSDKKLSELRKGGKGIKDKEQWYQPKGSSQLYFLFKIQIPRRTSPQLSGGYNPDLKDDFYNHLKSQPLQIPVPEKWTGPLKRALGAHNYEYDFSQAFKGVQERINPEVTRANLAKFLPWELKQAGVDRYLIAVISGADPFDNAALYYTQTSPEIIFEDYIKVMEDLGIFMDLPVRNELLFSEKARTFGTMIIPKEQNVRDLFKTISGFLMTKLPSGLAEWLNYHSYMALYTYLVLNLCTGHRPTVSAYANVSNFDLRGHRAFLADKYVTDVKQGRVVPLPQVAIDQMNAYRRHLDNFLIFLKGPDGDIDLAFKVMRCLDSEDEKYPFLFLFPALEEGKEFKLTVHAKILSPAPRHVRNHLDGLWPVPTNWHRHILRTFFTNYSAEMRGSGQLEKEISGELIDAFMGHAQFGLNPESPHSGFAFGELKKIVPALDAMLKEFGIKAVSP